MPNMSLKAVAMPFQDPVKRSSNYEEVALGYSLEQAREEAERCLKCKHKPCSKGCPVGVDIPGFIAHIQAGDPAEAYRVLSQTNSLPAVCGRVCPQETQCQAQCVRGIKGEAVAIGRLERFVADWYLRSGTVQTNTAEPKGRKVAVVGAGPAGLTCAGDLARLGYEVTIFEALHVAGGVMVYGIPEFRLPKSIVQAEIDNLKALGVQVMTNVVIGKTISVDELLEEEGFAAVFIGSGAGLPSFMNIPGENLKGVYSANEFLTRINLMKAYLPNAATPIPKVKNVAVVGGGNVAMDAARCAKRLGAENVYIVYRRSEQEMPARHEEIEHAKEEGIILKVLNNPTAVKGDDQGWVTALECVAMELGEPDASGRRRPIEQKGSEHLLDVNCVVMSIGTNPNPLIISTTKGLTANKWGCIVADEQTGLTSKTGVYAGGDAVTGAATVILAMGAGKAAAKAIDEYLRA